jgi:hypothetical protein
MGSSNQMVCTARMQENADYVGKICGDNDARRER